MDDKTMLSYTANHVYREGYEQGMSDSMKWIPFTEGSKPKLEEEVLLVCSGKIRNVTLDHAFEVGSRYIENGEELWFLNAWPGLARPTVHAWMPLPAPYKEDENDD